VRVEKTVRKVCNIIILSPPTRLASIRNRLWINLCHRFSFRLPPHTRTQIYAYYIEIILMAIRACGRYNHSDKKISLFVHKHDHIINSSIWRTLLLLLLLLLWRADRRVGSIYLRQTGLHDDLYVFVIHTAKTQYLYITICITIWYITIYRHVCERIRIKSQLACLHCSSVVHTPYVTSNAICSTRTICICRKVERQCLYIMLLIIKYLYRYYNNIYVMQANSFFSVNNNIVLLYSTYNVY